MKSILILLFVSSAAIAQNVPALLKSAVNTYGLTNGDISPLCPKILSITATPSELRNLCLNLTHQARVDDHYLPLNVGLCAKNFKSASTEKGWVLSDHSAKEYLRHSYSTVENQLGFLHQRVYLTRVETYLSAYSMPSDRNDIAKVVKTSRLQLNEDGTIRVDWTSQYVRQDNSTNTDASLANCQYSKNGLRQ